MNRLVCTSPAKTNLYLKVLNKRPDGFHNIKTLFQRIDLQDTIVLSDRRDDQIRVFCDHPHVPTGPKNLVYQVADRLRKMANIRRGVNIRISKKIPVAAGLAGGSSNAATVLSGLNRLWALGLSRRQLVALGGQIGSDVPFFLYETSWALGTDRGHKIRPISLDAKLWQVVVVPRVKLYTPRIYGALNLELTKKGDNVNILIRHLRKGDFQGIGRWMMNDLESAAVSFSPTLILLKKKIETLGAQGVMISGSGPSVFGVTETRAQAQRIKAVLAKRYSRVFVVKTL